jgi:hypothetical protein
MEQNLLPNSKFYKGQRVMVTDDVKLHFGGYIRKGDKGTVLNTEVIGTGKWTKVEMDKGFNMSFTNEDELIPVQN